MALPGQGRARPGLRPAQAEPGLRAEPAAVSARGLWPRGRVDPADAILFGAVGDWKYDKLERALRPEQAILGLRKHLGLFANFRPAICYPQLMAASSLKPELVAGLDILIIRELTGDIYFGQPRGRRTAVDGHFPGTEEAFDTMRYSRPEIERIARRLPGGAQTRQARHQRRQGQRAGNLPVLEGRGDRGARAVPGCGTGAHVGSEPAFGAVIRPIPSRLEAAT